MNSPIVHSAWVGAAPLTPRDVDVVNEVPRYSLYFLLILDRVGDVYIKGPVQVVRPSWIENLVQNDNNLHWL